MNDRFAVACLAFVTGVGFATVFDPTPAFVLLFFVWASAFMLLWRRACRARTAPVLLTVVVCVVAFGFGALRFDLAADRFGHSSLAPQLGEEVTLEGVISKEPDRRERTQQLIIETETDRLLVSTDRHVAVSYGDRVRVTGELEQPSAFVTEYGRTFEYANYLKARGIEYRVAFADVTVLDQGHGNPVVEGILAVKSWFLEQLALIIPEPAVGLGAGLLLGVQSGLGEELESAFRSTGIIHIVVLSGYNVMLVVSFILICLSFILARRARVTAALGAIVVFAVMVGLSATVVRASIMAALVLLAEATGRRYDVLRALVLAGTIMVLLNPYLLLYDIGFQLSFMATLGLILFLPHFETFLVTAPGRLLAVREFFFATVATQLAVLPLLIYHIGEVSVVAVLVNVIVLPLVPVAMLLTFLTGLLAAVLPSVAALFGWAATAVLSFIIFVAERFAALPFASLVVPPVPAWSVALMYGALGVGVWWLQRPRPVEAEEFDWIIEDEAAVEPEGSTAADGTPVFFR